MKEIKTLNIGKITKLAMWTDIHFGARNNSDQHNQDNINFLTWFIEKVKEEKPSHLAFLGDFFENRNAINVKTLDFATKACRMINDLGLPVIFIVGNHDLYHRGNREICSTNMFNDLENFILIDEPTKLNDEFFATPFLFKDEYPQMAYAINSHKYVLGHFEFRNFVVTGADRKMEHGPDATQFNGPRYIFSGHFHKRQTNKNIIYIGNTFPTNFGDANDSERGCAFLSTENEDVYFYDWEHAPLFFKTKLSEVLMGDSEFPAKSRVRCLLDIDVGYSEVQSLREEMISQFNLREFSVEEDILLKKNSLSEGLELETDLDLSSLDNTVRQLITEGVKTTPSIDPKKLIALYEELV